MLGATDPHQIENQLVESLDASKARMKREYIDVFILHGYVIPDGWQGSIRPSILSRIAVEWSNYRDHVVPTFEKLKADGQIGGWGITAASIQFGQLRVGTWSAPGGLNPSLGTSCCTGGTCLGTRLQ